MYFSLRIVCLMCQDVRKIFVQCYESYFKLEEEMTK